MNLKQYVEYCNGDISFLMKATHNQLKAYLRGEKHFDKDKLEYMEIQTKGLLNARDYLLERYTRAYEDLQRAKRQFQLEGSICETQGTEEASD